jgi:hypothetical protein
VIGLRGISWGLLAAGLACGTLADVAPPREPVFLGGYRVLSGDFHLHPAPYSASTLTPWDLMWDAQHQGLDVVAIAGQNEIWSGRAAHWVARHLGGPTVLAAEEIHGPRFHMIAVGIRSTVSWRLTAAQAIDEIHRQGGVAIAAHPNSSSWPAYDAAAMQHLDAAEVYQPVVFGSAASGADLRAFFARKPMAAIASSDWHGAGPPGLCRTWLFVKSNNGEEVLRAIRERRTVVYDGAEYFGRPELTKLAASEGRLRERPHPSPWAPPSRTLAMLGLLGLIVVCARPGAPAD